MSNNEENTEVVKVVNRYFCATEIGRRACVHIIW